LPRKERVGENVRERVFGWNAMDLRKRKESPSKVSHKQGTLDIPEV